MGVTNQHEWGFLGVWDPTRSQVMVKPLGHAYNCHLNHVLKYHFFWWFEDIDVYIYIHIYYVCIIYIYTHTNGSWIFAAFSPVRMLGVYFGYTKTPDFPLGWGTLSLVFQLPCNFATQATWNLHFPGSSLVEEFDALRILCPVMFVGL